MSKIFYPSIGLQRYDVPDGINMIFVDVVGSAGNAGLATAGKGGRVQCYIDVTNLRTLYIRVGNIPESGHIASYNASDIRTVNDINNMSSRIVVAGGGGSGCDYNTSETGNYSGGSAGGEVGFDGLYYGKAGDTASTGGTQTSGGIGGQKGSDRGVNGSNGTFGLGGNGGINTADFPANGGAGGAGWYGGGGGSAPLFKISIMNRSAGNGGAGGSSYANPTYCRNVVNKPDFNETSGYVEISEVQQPKDNSPRLFNGNKEIVTVSSGSENIVKIYKGSKLIWDVYRLFFESFVPQTKTLILPKGKYRITIAGAGGGGATATKNSFGASGGSGAVFKGVINIESGSYQVSVGSGGYGAGGTGGYVAGDGTLSKIGNLIIAGGGGGGVTDNHGGYAGVLTLNTTPVSTEFSSNGNNGVGYYGGGTTSRTSLPNASSFPQNIGTGGGGGYPNWGSGTNGGNGYVKIERIA